MASYKVLFNYHNANLSISMICSLFKMYAHVYDGGLPIVLDIFQFNLFVRRKTSSHLNSTYVPRHLSRISGCVNFLSEKSQGS